MERARVGDQSMVIFMKPSLVSVMPWRPTRLTGPEEELVLAVGSAGWLPWNKMALDRWPTRLGSEPEET